MEILIAIGIFICLIGFTSGANAEREGRIAEKTASKAALKEMQRHDTALAKAFAGAIVILGLVAITAMMGFE